MVQPILEMFGQKVSGNALKEVIAEADADGECNPGRNPTPAFYL